MARRPRRGGTEPRRPRTERARTERARTERTIDVVRRRLAGERGNHFVPGGPRICLLYPSPYRAGMSSLGFQWILETLRQAGFSAERAFLPDDVDAFRAEAGRDGGGLLRSYETGTPVGDFPLIGVSLAYELELAGLVTALQLSGIPPLRADRRPDHPRILLGGPLTFSNPLPAAPFVDAMLLGEAEDVVVDAVRGALEAPRDRWLDQLVALPGGYVPERHGTALPAVAKASDERLPARGPILAPEAELSDMWLVEGERGCHRQCTFCVMRRSTNGGMRLVTPDHLLSLVPDDARRVGLVGAAISDHPQLVGLLQALVDSGRGVGVSSLRADRVARKPDIPRLLRQAGYQTLTVASDAASQRLRRTMAKGTTEQHLLDCAQAAADHDYRVLKVYMMLGVPDETDDDVDELIAFTRQLAAIHPVALGIAPFVPKRNTPLDTASFAGIKQVEARLDQLRAGLRGTRAEVRATSARWAWVEAELAQGGPQAGLAVHRAVDAGGRFADWKRALQDVDPDSRAPWRSDDMPLGAVG
ncbi:MAG: radical SAM protein [Alphaproteobacteria bacterium]|nr:radical SAM protein [Alphaproteobacteria bacterium]